MNGGGTTAAAAEELSVAEGASILQQPPILDAYRAERSRRRAQQCPSLFVSADYRLTADTDGSADGDERLPPIGADAEPEERNVGMHDCVQCSAVSTRAVGHIPKCNTFFFTSQAKAAYRTRTGSFLRFVGSRDVANKKKSMTRT